MVKGLNSEEREWLRREVREFRGLYGLSASGKIQYHDADEYLYSKNKIQSGVLKERGWTDGNAKRFSDYWMRTHENPRSWETSKPSKIETKVAASIIAIGFMLSFLFISMSLTGYAIGGIGKENTELIGVVILVISVVSLYLIKLKKQGF